MAQQINYRVGLPLLPKHKIIVGNVDVEDIMSVFTISACSPCGIGEQSLIYLCPSCLTHYHLMPHFHALKIYSCGKHGEKRRNCL